MDISPELVDKQANIILNQVCWALSLGTGFAADVEIYVFGSVISRKSNWADVDLLIVTDNNNDMDRCRQLLMSLMAKFPLHVTIVSRLEFNELGATAWGRLHKLKIPGRKPSSTAAIRW